MTDAISHQARIAQSNTAVRNALDKVDKKSGSLAQSPVDDPKAVREKAGPETDSVSLSNVNQKVKDQPDFDRAKVDAIKQALSPRFVPNDMFQVAEIPRTLSGKKQELPIKKLMLGQPIDKVLNRDAMANPQCLAWYIDMAQRHLAQQPR